MCQSINRPNNTLNGIPPMYLGLPETNGLPPNESILSPDEQIKYLSAPETDGSIVRFDINGNAVEEQGYIRCDSEGKCHAISTITVMFANVYQYMSDKGVDFETACERLGLPNDIKEEVLIINECSFERIENELFKASLVNGQNHPRSQTELPKKVNDSLSSKDQPEVAGPPANRENSGATKREPLETLPIPGWIRCEVDMNDGRGARKVHVHAHNKRLISTAEKIWDEMRGILSPSEGHSKGHFEKRDDLRINPIMGYVNASGKERSLSEREVKIVSHMINQLPPELKHLVNELNFCEDLKDSNNSKVGGLYHSPLAKIEIEAQYLYPGQFETLVGVFLHEMTHQLEDLMAARKPDVFSVNYESWEKLLGWGSSVNSHVKRARVGERNHTREKNAPLNELIACSMGAYYSILAGMDPIEAFRLQHFDIVRMKDSDRADLLNFCSHVHQTYASNLNSPISELVDLSPRGSRIRGISGAVNPFVQQTRKYTRSMMSR